MKEWVFEQSLRRSSGFFQMAGPKQHLDESGENASVVQQAGLLKRDMSVSKRINS